MTFQQDKGSSDLSQWFKAIVPKREAINRQSQPSLQTVIAPLQAASWNSSAHWCWLKSCGTFFKQLNLKVYTNQPDFKLKTSKNKTNKQKNLFSPKAFSILRFLFALMKNIWKISFLHSNHQQHLLFHHIAWLWLTQFFTDGMNHQMVSFWHSPSKSIEQGDDLLPAEFETGSLVAWSGQGFNLVRRE